MHNHSEITTAVHLLTCTNKAPQATLKTLHTTLFTQLNTSLILKTCKIIMAGLEFLK